MMNQRSGLFVQPCYSTFSNFLNGFPVLAPTSERPSTAAPQRLPFPKLYPNIQCLSLYFPTLQQNVSADQFIRTLNGCRGLTELAICSSRLVDADFYERLVRLRCTRTLQILQIVSEPGEPVEDPTTGPNVEALCDIVLQEFKFLRRFETNLVSGSQMLELVRKRLEGGVSFSFQLGHCLIDFGHTPDTGYRARISNDVGLPQFQLPETRYPTLNAMLEAVRDKLDPPTSISPISISDSEPEPEPEPPSKRLRTE